ncbi:MAG: 30S ribosomal protein S19e [Candidatus Aenigmarchaeota archaeon]|nr:30S ribosomal protein S19e [Candidatus Aenigmarchaeota archaeon]
MITPRDVPADKFVEKLKEELKKIKEIKPQKWSFFVKSGAHKERPPDQSDFWYIRSASILRRLYLNGPVGVERLRTYYGGRKRRGRRPPKFRKASGAIIRKILQQLEAAGLVEKLNKRGRVLTPKGRSFLDRLAKVVYDELSKSG